MTNAESFLTMFEGNPSAHYTWKRGEYAAILRGIVLTDIERHIKGAEPGLLSIPVLPPGEDGLSCCHFACGDCDRHQPEDVGIDHPGVARLITERGLPLIITRSKSPKSAHIWLLFRDKNGFLCSDARRLVAHFMKLLGITGEIEVFPKQEILESGDTGSGINLPYFGQSRIAFGRDGEELNLEQFIALVHERQSFGKVLAQHYLVGGPSEHRAPGAARAVHGPMTAEAVRRVHANNLTALVASNVSGHWDIELNDAAFWAGRAATGGALGSEVDVKSAIRTAAAPRTQHDERIVEDKLERSWEDGLAQSLTILDEVNEHDAALARITAWLGSNDTENPKHEDAYNDLSKLTEEEFAPLRKNAARRLDILAAALDKFVMLRRASYKESRAKDAATAPEHLTKQELRNRLSDLLFTTEFERRMLDLPQSLEKASQNAEEILWQYITENADVFCTESGQGYLLFNDAKEAPIPVTKDGHELNAFLSGLGIHAGASSRNRIGKHIGNSCWRYGTRCEPRISFHYDSVTFCGYFAEEPGSLIKVTASEISRVANGCDGQLFLLPRNYSPWHIELDNLPPTTDIGPDASALLPELLFDVLEFENESLCRDDVCVLLNAYICTLFMPGVVAGKLLLEIQGGTGSGKTLFARMLGRLIYGPSFEVAGMDTDPAQFENAIVNNSFLVLDDVKRTSDVTILGMIRRACTGGRCNRRELYSTFGQISEPYRASLAITCSEEVFTGSDEMCNRELIIFAKQRDGYLDETELLKRIDGNRDALMSEMMVRLQNVIMSVKAQANFKPVVKMRMASFATFLMRVGRQWDWGVSAEQVLDCWREEQQGTGVDSSIAEALACWFRDETFEQGKRYSASELHRNLMKMANNPGQPGSNPWWYDKGPALIRSMRNSFHAYQRHFGFCFEGRTSGHKPASYWFDFTKVDEEAKKSLPEKFVIPF